MPLKRMVDPNRCRCLTAWNGGRPGSNGEFWKERNEKVQRQGSRRIPNEALWGQKACAVECLLPIEPLQVEHNGAFSGEQANQGEPCLPCSRRPQNLACAPPHQPSQVVAANFSFGRDHSSATCEVHLARKQK